MNELAKRVKAAAELRAAIEAERRRRGLADCDLCTLRGIVECPGVDAHCSVNEHCASTDASCAAAARLDPCLGCCSCKAPLEPAA